MAGKRGWSDQRTELARQRVSCEYGQCTVHISALVVDPEDPLNPSLPLDPSNPFIPSFVDWLLPPPHGMVEKPSLGRRTVLMVCCPLMKIWRGDV